MKNPRFKESCIVVSSLRRQRKGAHKKSPADAADRALVFEVIQALAGAVLQNHYDYQNA
jgi:hypothetical protein